MIQIFVGTVSIIVSTVSKIVSIASIMFSVVCKVVGTVSVATSINAACNRAQPRVWKAEIGDTQRLQSEFLKVNAQQPNFLGMALFAFIIISVKF